MFDIIPKVLLPIALVLMMLVMGLGLTLRDFKRVFQFPTTALIGLSLQLFMLPCLALLIGYLFQLPFYAGAGLFLLSLCPGGVTSNFFSFIGKGNVALSISLTAVTSFIVPFSLPFLFSAYLGFFDNHQAQVLIKMPVFTMIGQLFLVAIFPLLLGMLTKYFWPEFTFKIEKKLKFIATINMLLVVLGLIATNLPLMAKGFTASGIAVLSLSITALLVAYVIANFLLISKRNIRTITLEVGVQNAGTAILVAHTALQTPELATIPLLYGIFMNLPVFVFIYWVNRKP